MLTIVGSNVIKLLSKCDTYRCYQMLYCTNDCLLKESYDVVVVGGGLIGSAMACGLGNSPKFSDKNILLLESGSKKKSWVLSPHYSNRVSAISPNSKNFLEKISSWNHICESRMRPVECLQVWEAQSEASITFDYNNCNEDVAYIVENDVIIHALTLQLESMKARVSVLHDARVSNIHLPDKERHFPTLELDDGRRIQTKLLIGADGFSSKVRSAMDVKWISWNYEQMGVVATVGLTESSENNIAWQRFLPSGPIALLPLSDNFCSLVWSTTTAHARQLLELSADEFVDNLNQALWSSEYTNPLATKSVRELVKLLSSIGAPCPSFQQLPPKIQKLNPEDSRAMFPLGFGHALRYVSKRTALIGDAAHRVHPLAGQGANLGFGDVSSLVDLLEVAVSNGQDVGSSSTLLEYETTRQHHNLAVMATIEGLHQLYTSDNSVAAVLRAVGLSVVNAVTPVKNFIRATATN